MYREDRFIYIHMRNNLKYNLFCLQFEVSHNFDIIKIILKYIYKCNTKIK